MLKEIKLPAIYHSLTPPQRRLVRERYVLNQKGLCWYCKSLLKDKSPHDGVKPVNRWRFPDGFFNWPVHLHHDHGTGMTIGAVHAYCNAVSFDYDESPI